MSDENKFKGEGIQVLSTTDLTYILDVNRKSVELYLAVEQQNEEVLRKLEKLDELIEEIGELKNELIEEIDEVKSVLNNTKTIDEENNKLLTDINPKIDNTKDNLYKLIVFLGLVGAATIFQILQVFLHK